MSGESYGPAHGERVRSGMAAIQWCEGSEKPGRMAMWGGKPSITDAICNECGRTIAIIKSYHMADRRVYRHSRHAP